MDVSAKDYASDQKPTWCPGCGDYGILNAVRQGLAAAGLAPHDVLIVSGIGCGSKLPDYMHVNGFMTLHGRPLPVATGAKLANHGLRVITVHGDGDSMGLGMGHFIHAARRNIGIVDLIQNNQIYGLTKGQYSPTSEQSVVTSTSLDGSFEQAANPLALALAAGATFVARGFAGDTKALAELIAVAVRHRGYAIVDILQPCVTFNKRNTYDFFRDRLYDLSGAGHDTSNRVSAFAKALEWGEHIPTGIFYQADLPGYEEQVAALQEGPLAKRPLERLTPEQVEGLLAEFV